MAENTVRTDIRTPPSLKEAYADFCEKVMRVPVSARTRYLWRQDMIAFDGATEDAPKETA